MDTVFLNHGQVAQENPAEYITTPLDINMVAMSCCEVTLYDPDNSFEETKKIVWNGELSIRFSNDANLVITETTAGLTYYSGDWRDIYCTILAKESPAGEKALDNKKVAQASPAEYITTPLDHNMVAGDDYRVLLKDSSNNFYEYKDITWNETVNLTFENDAVLELTQTTAGLTYYSGDWRDIYCDIISFTVEPEPPGPTPTPTPSYEDCIDNLFEASRGKEVKKALVDILNAANDRTGDADTLEFHGAGYFVKSEDFNELCEIVNWIKKNMNGLNGEYMTTEGGIHKVIYEGSFVPWET